MDTPKWLKVTLIALIAYAVFYSGGIWSFDYTHTCVRSHTAPSYNQATEDVTEVQVCDYYTGNTKHWSLLDPIRAFTGF